MTHPNAFGGRFAGKVAVVTGASSGIGRAAAVRLAAEGARVALIARRESELSAVQAELWGDGHFALVLDCADEARVAEGVKTIKTAFGGIDVAVLAAGAHMLRPAALTGAKQLSQMYEANVITTHVVARALIPLMSNRNGAMTAVSSVAGLRGSPGVVAYAAAKAALNSIVQTLAREVASKRIRVNAVVAGVVQTPMGASLLNSLTVQQQAELVSAHPLGLGAPDDVAAAICFLASDEARWITGSLFAVDGGLSCG